MSISAQFTFSVLDGVVTTGDNEHQIDVNAPMFLTAAQVREICKSHYEPLLEAVAIKSLGRMERIRDDVNIYPENQAPAVPNTYVHDMWLWFLQEKIVASLSNAFQAAEAPSTETLVPSKFIPALIYVKLVSVFEEGLAFYMDNNSYTLPANQRPSLENRLRFLSNQGVLTYTDDLLAIRNKRNGVAHRPTSTANWFGQQISWQSLEDAVNTVETAMQTLGLIGTRPNYEAFIRRENDPVPADRTDVAWINSYYYGVNENGKPVLEFIHTWQYYKFSPEELEKALE